MDWITNGQFQLPSCPLRYCPSFLAGLPRDAGWSRSSAELRTGSSDSHRTHNPSRSDDRRGLFPRRCDRDLQPRKHDREPRRLQPRQAARRSGARQVHCVSALAGYRGDIPFRAGQRYALLLRTAPAPIGLEFRRVFRWRESADFEVWDSDNVGTSGGQAFTDSAAAELYSAIWRFRRLPRERQAALVAVWARSPGPPYAWAMEAIGRHPDLGSTEPVRDFLLGRLRNGWDMNREWAARQLALNPDTTTRQAFSSLAHADSTGPGLAVLLGSHDHSPWVRHTILSIADETLASAPGPAPDILRLNGPDVDRWVITLANYEPSRRRYSRTAQMPSGSCSSGSPSGPVHVTGCDSLLLRPLAHDTSQVVRDLIWQTVEGDPAGRSVWVEDAPEPGNVTPYWTTKEPHRALLRHLVHHPLLRL